MHQEVNRINDNNLRKVMFVQDPHLDGIWVQLGLFRKIRIEEYSSSN